MSFYGESDAAPPFRIVNNEKDYVNFKSFSAKETSIRDKGLTKRN